jgi:GNAT superfamily N-acetyltransferase
MEFAELDPRSLDVDTAGAIAEVLMAARRAETSDPIPTTGPTVRLHKRYGWGDERPDWLTVARDGGRIVGVATLMFPRQANRHLAYVWIDVDPARQRRGIGSALLARAEDRTRAEGRRSLTGFTLRDGSGAAFAAARGFTPGLDNALRRLDLTDSDPARWVDHRAEALRHAADYELVRVLGPSDDALLTELTPLYAAINDAPTGDLDIEPMAYDMSSIRAYERAMAQQNQTMYHVLARRRSDGAWAGHTIALVDRHMPTWAGQDDTAVVPEHRGHRLGLAMKADLIAWLTEVEPQVRWLQTWNAESNRHMLAVNEALGFVLFARSLQHQKALDGDRV